jgi:hypothetical protein
LRREQPLQERVDRALRLAGRRHSVVGARCDQRDLAERGEQHVREAVDQRRVEPSGRGEPAQRQPEQPHPVAFVDRAPALPAEHRRRVDERHPPHRRIAHQVEPGPAARPQRGLGVLDAARGRHEPLDPGRLDRLDDGLEQRRLAGEMVVERAPAQPGGAQDLVDRDVLVAALGEQAPRGAHQGRPGPGAALFLGFHGP